MFHWCFVGDSSYRIVLLAKCNWVILPRRRMYVCFAYGVYGILVKMEQGRYIWGAWELITLRVEVLGGAGYCCRAGVLIIYKQPMRAAQVEYGCDVRLGSGIRRVQGSIERENAMLKGVYTG